MAQAVLHKALLLLLPPLLLPSRSGRPHMVQARRQWQPLRTPTTPVTSRALELDPRGGLALRAAIYSATTGWAGGFAESTLV